MVPREKWTDERLDDLNRKVDHGFARLEARIDQLDAKFDAKFDRLTLGLLASAIGIVATVILS